jgi:hypothetical protein
MSEEKTNYHIKAEWLGGAAAELQGAFLKTVALVESTIVGAGGSSAAGANLPTALLTTLVSLVAVAEVQMELHKLRKEDRVTLREQGARLAASFLAGREGE